MKRRAKAVTDKERLDWLDREDAQVTTFYNGIIVRVGNHHGQSERSTFKKSSLREAIDECRERFDAAIRQQKRGGRK